MFLWVKILNCIAFYCRDHQRARLVRDEPAWRDLFDGAAAEREEQEPDRDAADKDQHEVKVENLDAQAIYVLLNLYLNYNLRKGRNQTKIGLAHT